ncbi:unnamed protein product [Penicillium salamii]|uniref:DNA (cytosine-5-)-methyltransferase n=1 Tax=Penicillium salamii TaxID=1612424 RepID=A0A9W4NCI8_9EURO|nr:unnamed protein product [Penicillium salamii]
MTIFKSSINPMAAPKVQSHSSERPFAFISHPGTAHRDTEVLSLAGEDVDLTDSSLSGLYDTFIRRTEDMRVEIDSSGDDDFFEQSMSQLTFNQKDETLPSAENYSSAARALHKTSTRHPAFNRPPPPPLTESFSCVQKFYDLTLDTEAVTDNSATTSTATTRLAQKTFDESQPVYWHDGIFYKAGMCVEFKDHSFMKILGIVPQSDDLSFFGWRIFRSTHAECGTFLPKINNELVWVTQVEDFMSSRFVKRKVRIRFTNFRSSLMSNPRRLTCRLKLTIRQSGVVLGSDLAPITSDQYAIEYLEYNETDPGLGKWSNELRAEWRGETVPFGAAEKSSRALEIERETGIIDLEPERTYTFGDTFCGGGGVSCGAKQAGLKLKYANDSDEKALSTYLLNHSDVETECSDFNTFVTNDAKFLHVDIAHASPPCQTFSPAHTVNSSRDEANSACIFSGVDLARVSKCRVLTLEETSGLPTRHILTFNRMVLSLVEIGFSVRWSILGCDRYGVPQDRKRLMIIAAGPGETLPHYAEPTHGDSSAGSKVLPRATIGSTIKHIPVGAPDHNPARGLERWRLSHREAFEPESLAKTITCGGGEFNYHPSGKRPYTDREMAVLQTFPMNYQFSGVYTRKQIGNAVPPLFAKAIYSEVVRSLRETDRAEAQGKFR